MSKIEEMSLEELCIAEKAATIIRKTYEDQSAIFRSIPMDHDSKDYEKYKELSSKLAYFNALRLRIREEMENKLKKLVSDD